MKIKYLGQNSFLFSYKGINILTDPFYSAFKDQSGFDISAQSIDYLLITHVHGDHIADAADAVKEHPEVTVVGQMDITLFVGHTKNVDINIGGNIKVDDLEITMVPATHTSSFANGNYGGIASGYIIKFPDGENIYLAGDTGLTSEMSLFPQYFGKIKLAILPMGGHYTMDAKAAAFAASELLKFRKVLGCHFDTIPQLAINHEEAIKYFDEKGIELILPKLGEEIEVL